MVFSFSSHLMDPILWKHDIITNGSRRRRRKNDLKYLQYMILISMKCIKNILSKLYVSVVLDHINSSHFSDMFRKNVSYAFVLF